MPRNPSITVSFDDINPLFCHSKTFPKRIKEVSTQKVAPSLAN
jgi:hypothetical protein